MEIHQQLYDLTQRIHSKYAEDIGRGIERGFRSPGEADIALGLLADIDSTVKQIEGVRTEFDVEERMSLSQDIQCMKAAIRGLNRSLAVRSGDDLDIWEGLIFHEALFAKL